MSDSLSVYQSGTPAEFVSERVARRSCGPRMSLKEEVHALIDELPEDSASLRELRESLRLSKAIAKSVHDIRHGRVYTAEAFMAKVRAAWPKNSPKTQEPS
jgi:hypothetical protein